MFDSIWVVTFHPVYAVVTQWLLPGSRIDRACCRSAKRSLNTCEPNCGG